jgi:predicted amidophosphoribosyltransferase
MDVECNIDNMPTIEAKPKHGKWVWKDHYLVCSECGEENDRKNYCPNCGARMNGEENG